MLIFSKMQGTGNDFVVIDCINQKLNYNLSVLSKFLCNRNFGVGADGVIFIFKSNIADFKMRIFNQDGTEAEMCGNGIRCMGKFLYEKKLTSKQKLKIETMAGIKNVELNFKNKNVIGVKVDMGIPVFDLDKIPAYLPERKSNSRLHNAHIMIDKKESIFNLVSMGNPHAVCFCNDLNKVDIKKFGPIVENYKYFPNKTNVEFVQIVDKNTVKIKVWERGVGETNSCGTGACAVAVCCREKNLTEKNVNVILEGGKLYIEVEKNVFLSGPAEISFEGKIF